jgi:predicted RNA-binding Zn-ribbon protein involved in translation (DUF1610 family)
MAAHAGETAQRTGDFRCSNCRNRIHVTQGRKIPKCPHCGGSTYDEREKEPRNR